MNKYNNELEYRKEQYVNGLIHEIEYLRAIQHMTEKRLSALKNDAKAVLARLKVPV